jgi:hypothetical protein
MNTTRRIITSKLELTVKVSTAQSDNTQIILHGVGGKRAAFISVSKAEKKNTHARTHAHTKERIAEIQLEAE